MDGQKPNHRPRKQKTHYGAELAKREQQHTLEVATAFGRDVPRTIHARGEEFTSDLKYSMNKGRRWELTEEDFEVAEEDQKVAVARGTKVAVARGQFGHKEAELNRKERAFRHQYENGPVDPTSEDDTPAPTTTTKKDRKHFSTKAPKKNRQMANSHSEEIYRIAEADVLVSITETSESVKPFTNVNYDYDKKHGMPRQVRAHKYKHVEV